MARLVLLLLVAAIAYAIWRVVRRGRDFAQLVRDGVDARGVVVRKTTFGTAAARRHNRFLDYRYQDDRGAEHSHRSKVTPTAWDAHEEGGPIEIVYSRSQPQISAPRWLVEPARAAMARRGDG